MIRARLRLLRETYRDASDPTAHPAKSNHKLQLIENSNLDNDTCLLEKSNSKAPCLSVPTINTQYSCFPRLLKSNLELLPSETMERKGQSGLGEFRMETCGQG